MLSLDDLASALRRWGIGTHPREWRLPPIETYPAVVGFAQTVAGRVVLFAVFAALLKPLNGMWLELTIAAAATSLAGRYRHVVALACTAALLVRAPSWFNSGASLVSISQEILGGTIPSGYLRAATMSVCIPLAVTAIYLARRFRDHPLGRRPVLAQHILCFGLIGLAASHALGGLPQVLLWSVTATFAAYFWFLAYALMDQRQPAPMPLQFASLHPFFVQATVVPIGRGAAAWQAVEARTSTELAVTQLKALKLLAWALLLKAVLWLFRRVVYGKLGIVPLAPALVQFVADRDAPVPFGLVTVIVNFPEQLLAMAVWGHVAVAVARLAGFRLLRNTYRPLSSRTIAEFWNRYFYYFKEVLVHVYFYPTYVRWFKQHARLRLAFATFMAAGAGNFLFHFILENDRIARFGLLEALVRMQTYAFYCALLAAGIILSQLRAHRPDASAGWWRGRFVPSLGVAAFFCLLSFFDGTSRPAPLAQHFAFLFKVFGVDRWMQTTG